MFETFHGDHELNVRRRSKKAETVPDLLASARTPDGFRLSCEIGAALLDAARVPHHWSYPQRTPVALSAAAAVRAVGVRHVLAYHWRDRLFLYFSCNLVAGAGRTTTPDLAATLPPEVARLADLWDAAWPAPEWRGPTPCPFTLVLRTLPPEERACWVPFETRLLYEERSQVAEFEDEENGIRAGSKAGRKPKAAPKRKRAVREN